MLKGKRARQSDQEVERVLWGEGAEWAERMRMCLRFKQEKKKKGIWVRMFFPASRMRGQKHFGYLYVKFFFLFVLSEITSFCFSLTCGKILKGCFPLNIQGGSAWWWRWQWAVRKPQGEHE